MVAWGQVLSPSQLRELVGFIRTLSSAPATAAPTASGPVSFSAQVEPILQAKCVACHNNQTKLGGWDATSYAGVMTSGTHAPVIKPGDVAGSLLAGKLTGTQGTLMPPSGALPAGELQIILDWIAAGAKDD